MNSKNVSVKLEGNTWAYDVRVDNGLLNGSGVWARDCLSEYAQKVAIISNARVFGLYGKIVEQSFLNQGFEVCIWLMPDGEQFKNFESLEESLSFFSQNNLKRTDAVIALGGGVVGDLAGLAAATYMRGVSFLQIPTTVLAMIDSSVGGKTAVNTSFGKNLVGVFHQPNGVLVDVETLKTLEHREVVAGFCEAIKQGAIGSRTLFDDTAAFLKQFELSKFQNYFEDESFIKFLEQIIASQIAFKAEIVMQDEREAMERSDIKSRKILNFGHTTAHALEKITDYKYFKHGEAVGYGILVAGQISKRLDICGKNSINLLKDVVRTLGVLPDTSKINIDELLKLFVFDKKAIDKSLQWILLEDIGKPKILSNQNIPHSIIIESLQEVLHK